MTAKVLRNDVCPCGSSRKFKVCCLHARSVHTTAPAHLAVHIPTALTRRQTTLRPVAPREWQKVEAVLELPTGEAFVAVIVYSRQWLRAKKVGVGSPLSLNIPQYRLRGEGRVRSIRASQEIPEGEGLVLSIERVGETDAQNLPPANQRAWQQVHVRLDEPGGTHVYAVLLHSHEWLTNQRIESGGVCELNMPAQKVLGKGRVALIEPSPIKSDDEGRLMTFVRSNRKGEKTHDPLSRPGVRTYFGERLPPVGHGWLEMVLARDGKQKSDLRFARTDEWLQAFRQVAGEQPDIPEPLPADVADWRLVRVTVAVQQEQKAHIVFFLPKQVVEERALTVDEPVLLRLPKDHFSGEGSLTTIEPAPFVPGGDEPMGRMFISGKCGSRSKGTIEAMEVGDYVTTYTQAERGDRLPLDDTQGEWVARLRIRLHLDKEDGGHSKMVLLRGSEWVRAERVAMGGTVYLNMPEMGCVGHARVEAIEPCMVFRRWGNSTVRMVTGTFAHTPTECGDLKLKGESEPIGVTPSHPVWSEDRFDWVPAGELRPGETVKTIEGTTAVESYTLRAQLETVFNLEVDADHCYRVGEQGILVHNASGDCKPVDTVCKRMISKEDYDKLEESRKGPIWVDGSGSMWMADPGIPATYGMKDSTHGDLYGKDTDTKIGVGFFSDIKPRQYVLIYQENRDRNGGILKSEDETEIGVRLYSGYEEHFAAEIAAGTVRNVMGRRKPIPDKWEIMRNGMWEPLSIKDSPYADFNVVVDHIIPKNPPKNPGTGPRGSNSYCNLRLHSNQASVRKGNR